MNRTARICSLLCWTTGSVIKQTFPCLYPCPLCGPVCLFPVLYGFLLGECEWLAQVNVEEGFVTVTLRKTWILMTTYYRRAVISFLPYKIFRINPAASAKISEDCICQSIFCVQKLCSLRKDKICLLIVALIG